MTNAAQTPAIGDKIDVQSDINWQWFGGYEVVALHPAGFSYDNGLDNWRFMPYGERRWRRASEGK
jgi:hypothetical protein